MNAVRKLCILGFAFCELRRNCLLVYKERLYSMESVCNKKFEQFKSSGVVAVYSFVRVSKRHRTDGFHNLWYIARILKSLQNLTPRTYLNCNILIIL